MPLIKRKIKDDTYNRKIWVYGGTEKELSRAFPNGWDNATLGRFTAIDENDGEETLYVGVLRHGTAARRRGVLAHECLHTTFYVMQLVGVTLCDNSEEAFTYFFDSLYRKASAVLGL